MPRESFDVLPWADAWLLLNQLLTKHAGHTATSTENKGADVVQRGCGLFSLAIDTRITSIFCVM
ncbi:hypothetical protein NEOLEDRAFT_1128819 [Neolentinus lepideus HHB14362 ss-1]|uniref:Uncharacterized protein n=1 Tax=Neolentinus lepideus HHB14362 ss-1 TaxID=1314782 RepID=A0A165SKQ8_9AGAM|nr:hypothetical protein NEOLEDRAFT_1133679 [Neolentinus lepideus HHB14362 ss-1]KZT28662.1 hypothetical protein NEOLEDRAFT_1128819 [Neolentinus lepideus HHB14362 ss-1]